MIIASFGTFIHAQNFDRINITASIGGKSLKFPGAGGIKAGQFSNIDFNNDGKMDLFVFDRNGGQILPFLKTGNKGTLDYTFAPEYISMFPSIQNWALLVDYNNDGVKDIFASSGKYPGSIEVWKGSRDQNGRLTFKLKTFNYGLAEILQFPISNGFTQIYVSSIDLPAIADVDGDGDMDILSFEADGSFASFYKNVSVEENLGIDSLKYIRQDICWGKFAENQFNEKIILSDNAFGCASGFTSSDNTGLRHSGSTLTVFDNDGDGDMDLVIGDIGSSKLIRLYNGGTKSIAHVTSQELNFPKEDMLVDLDFFLGAYFVDVDDDGKRDLIVTPNEINSGESSNHIWLYLNTGTDSAPIFKLTKKNFLLDEMLFFNSASHPVFGDLTGDGLMDILVGTNGIQQKNGIRKNRIVLLTNNGTLTNPSYTVTDEDYLIFSQYGDAYGRFAPTLGDIDQDGDQDLVVGDFRGQLFLFINSAGKNNPPKFEAPIYPYKDIFVGQNAKPQLVDLDADGLVDLVIGEKNNELNYLKNIGIKGQPDFNPNADNLPNTRQAGKIFVGNDFETQNGAPCFFQSENKMLMIFGTEDAGFPTYSNIENNQYNNYNLLYQKTGNINQGRKVTCSLSDIDNDGYYEMVVGNERGGLAFYNTIFKTPTISSSENQLSSSQTITIYPNPAHELVYIQGSEIQEHIHLFDQNGVSVGLLKNNEWNDIKKLPSGTYFIKYSNSFYTYPLIIVR